MILALCLALAASLGAALYAFQSLRTYRRRMRVIVAGLHARAARRGAALAEATQRYAVALEASRVTVFSQDSDLAYRWVSQPFRDLTPEELVGRKDSDFMPAEAVAQLDRIKRSVLASGATAHAEIRVESGASPAWYDLTVMPTLARGGAVDGVIGGAVDITDRKQFDAHVRLLMRELTHRSKNLLAVVQALMRQTASHADNIQDFSRRFAARLESVAAAYDLLIKDDWRGTTLAELVASQLAHYTDTQASQIEISGPSLRLPPDSTQNIGMALHELATNAAKYGALSVPTGKVEVRWALERDPQGEATCRISWQESGGPIVGPPGRRGFGQVVIERTVARAVNGAVTLAYNPGGLEWTLVFPVAA